MALGNRNAYSRHGEDSHSDYWLFKPGQRVMTCDGFAGTVASVVDGPHAGNEHYVVDLENGMGGGAYQPGQLTALRQETADHHTAADDYPELTQVLYDRPDIAPNTVTAAKKHANASCPSCGTWSAINNPNESCPACGHEMAHESEGMLTPDHWSKEPQRVEFPHRGARDHYMSTGECPEGEEPGFEDGHLTWGGQAAQGEGEDYSVLGVPKTSGFDRDGKCTECDQYHSPLLRHTAPPSGSCPECQGSGYATQSPNDGNGTLCPACGGRETDEEALHRQVNDAFGGPEAAHIMGDVLSTQPRGPSKYSHRDSSGMVRTSKASCDNCGGFNGSGHDGDRCGRCGTTMHGPVEQETHTDYASCPQCGYFCGWGHEGDCPTCGSPLDHRLGSLDTGDDHECDHCGGWHDESEHNDVANFCPGCGLHRSDCEGVGHDPAENQAAIHHTRDWHDTCSPYGCQVAADRQMDHDSGDHSSCIEGHCDQVHELGCTDCHHDCPHQRSTTMGAPYCSRCDDHYENRQFADHDDESPTRPDPLNHDTADYQGRNYAESDPFSPRRITPGDAGRTLGDIDEVLRHQGISVYSMLVDAAADSEFRFEITASWSDVRRKAKRLRTTGQVTITAASTGVITGVIKGDHFTYETQIQRLPGHLGVAIWQCGCKWAAYAWGRSAPYKRFEGRMCSHALALHYEAQSRGMFGREITPDERRPDWLRAHSPIVTEYDIDRDRNLTRRAVPPGNMRRTFGSAGCPGCGADMTNKPTHWRYNPRTGESEHWDPAGIEDEIHGHFNTAEFGEPLAFLRSNPTGPTHLSALMTQGSPFVRMPGQSHSRYIPDGYAYEAGIHCTHCTAHRFGDPDNEHLRDDEDNPISPYDGGDDPHGEHCDDCGDLVSEGYEHQPGSDYNHCDDPDHCPTNGEAHTSDNCNHYHGCGHLDCETGVRSDHPGDPNAWGESGRGNVDVDDQGRNYQEADPFAPQKITHQDAGHTLDHIDRTLRGESVLHLAVREAIARGDDPADIALVMHTAGIQRVAMWFQADQSYEDDSMASDGGAGGDTGEEGFSPTLDAGDPATAPGSSGLSVQDYDITSPGYKDGSSSYFGGGIGSTGSVTHEFAGISQVHPPATTSAGRKPQYVGQCECGWDSQPQAARSAAINSHSIHSLAESPEGIAAMADISTDPMMFNAPAISGGSAGANEALNAPPKPSPNMSANEVKRDTALDKIQDDTNNYQATLNPSPEPALPMTDGDGNPAYQPMGGEMNDLEENPIVNSLSPNGGEDDRTASRHAGYHPSPWGDHRDPNHQCDVCGRPLWNGEVHPELILDERGNDRAEDHVHVPVERGTARMTQDTDASGRDYDQQDPFSPRQAVQVGPSQMEDPAHAVEAPGNSSDRGYDAMEESAPELTDNAVAASLRPNETSDPVWDIVESFQRSAAHLDPGPGGNAGDTGDIAAAAREYLQKSALKDFTLAEQAALINEGEGVTAANLDRLSIEGTHYEALEAALAAEDNDPVGLFD